MAFFGPHMHMLSQRHRPEKVNMRLLPHVSSFRGYAQYFRATIDYVDPHILYRDTRVEIYNLLNRFNSLRLRIIICVIVFFTKWDDIEGEKNQFLFASGKNSSTLSNFGGY